MELELVDEEFHDYTSATPWEKLTADVERVLRSWKDGLSAGDGPVSLEAVLEHRLPFRKESYRMYLQSADEEEPKSPSTTLSASTSSVASGSISAWLWGRHSLQRWFAVGTYVLLAPSSFSQRVQDDQEAATLLSALSLALRSAAAPWPAFVPLHNVYRQRWLGVQACQSSSGRCVHRFFESDSTQSSQHPTGLLFLHNQLALFAKALGPHCPEAAAAAEAAITSDINSLSGSAAFSFSLSARQKLSVPSMSTGCCQTPGTAADEDGSFGPLQDWDEGAPWRAWAQPVDPVGGVELELLWEGLPGLMERNSFSAQPPSRDGATLWLLSAIARETGRPALPPPLLSLDAFGQGTPPKGGLVEMLACFAEASNVGRGAESANDLIDEFWYRSHRPLPRVPPEPIMQNVLRDIFAIDTDEPPTVTLPGPDSTEAKQPSQMDGGLGLLKAAPPGSLLLRLALHSLAFGNARAVAQLWVRFVRELRFRYWEVGQPLPRLRHTNSPDLAACLVHQKLEMLDICIRALQEGGAAAAGLEPEPEAACEVDDSGGNNGDGGRSSSDGSFVSCAGEGADDATMSEEEGNGVDLFRNTAAATDSGDVYIQLAEAKGVAGKVAGEMRLLEAPHRMLNVPRLQRPAILTEDLLTAREEVLHSLGSNKLDDVHVRLQGDQLMSDMSAFKAANPGCVFEDFIRWYSPTDWESDPSQRRGQLSKRMAVRGNTWQTCWELAESRPALEQKPLFEPSQEGERALHFLETLQPGRVFEELLTSGIAAAVGLLAQSAGASLPEARQINSDVMQQVGAVLQQQVGSDAERGYVVHKLAHLERAVLVGESLLRRLGNQAEGQQLANSLLSAAVGRGGEMAKRTGAARTVVKTATEQQHIAMLLSLDGEGCRPPDTHRQLEWMIECQPVSGGRLPGSGSHMLTTLSPDGIHIATAITVSHS